MHQGRHEGCSPDDGGIFRVLPEFVGAKAVAFNNSIGNKRQQTSAERSKFSRWSGFRDAVYLTWFKRILFVKPQLDKSFIHK